MTYITHFGEPLSSITRIYYSTENRQFNPQVVQNNSPKYLLYSLYTHIITEIPTAKGFTMIRNIFSFAPYYGVLATILAVCMGVGVFPTMDVPVGITATIFIAIVLIALITIISSVASVFNHLDNLANLREYTNNVKNYEEHVEQIKESIKMITDNSKDFDADVLAKSNVDHPIVKAMRELTDAQDRLRDCKNRVGDYAARISARATGPFSWVVANYGDK